MLFFKKNSSVKTRVFLSITCLLFMVSCASTKGNGPTDSSMETENILRVGITTNYPPLVFKEHGKFQGIEIDFAKLLAKELGRPVRAINLPWEQQIPYLLQGKTDIIMSGLSITSERSLRIAFTSPYMVTGLVAAMRNSDKEIFRTKEDLMQKNIAIGVIRDTVGEKYVKQHFVKASRIVLFENADHAAVALTENKITLFIHDAPAVMWIVSKHESDICGLWTPLNEEKLAWGIRREEKELQTKLDNIIEKWQQDGTIDSIVKKWLPYELVK